MPSADCKQDTQLVVVFILICTTSSCGVLHGGYVRLHHGLMHHRITTSSRVRGRPESTWNKVTPTLKPFWCVLYYTVVRIDAQKPKGVIQHRLECGMTQVADKTTKYTDVHLFTSKRKKLHPFVLCELSGHVKNRNIPVIQTELGSSAIF